MHAKMHLYDVAKQALGEDARDAVETWVNATETPLYNRETSQVIACIRDLETQNPAMGDVLEREVGYFQKHSNRMQYQTFNEKGYQIGSGVIESACKHVSLNAVNRLACDGANLGSMRYFFGDVY